MIVLEEPYASDLLLEWASQEGHPVLRSPFSTQLSESRRTLNLIDESEAARRVNSGERVYTNSENALDWILSRTSNETLNHAIRLFKDKRAMREALSTLSPQLFFKAYVLDELRKIDPSDLPLPAMLKPSVGFCSMGVYAITSPDDWTSATKSIDDDKQTWAKRYPESVIDTAEFIVEGYIEGPEYAVDMYYDNEGRANLLNIMHHDFADAEDTSDRLYNTSLEIIDNTYDLLADWLDEANEIVGARNFPAHVEVRISSDGNVIPIEFNPLRFAGLGGTDLAYYAWGIRTYASFLNGEKVDLKKVASAHPGKVFTMSLLNPSPKADLSKPFDYDALAARFSKVLDFHRFDVNAVGSYGFLFLETDDSTAEELEFLLHSDLLEFVPEFA